MIEKYVRILLVFGMAAVICGTAGAAMGIVAETQVTSVGNYPLCNSPCECLPESTAAARWGAEGYERCSKTVCGESISANVQYYCFRPVGGTTSSSLTTCQAPCECLTRAGAAGKWGEDGYSQCTQTMCGRDQTSVGEVPRYCYRQFGSTLLIGRTAAPTTTAAPAAGTPATVQAPVQTQPPAQATVTGTAAPVTPSPSYTWPAASATPQQRTPVGIQTIFTALCIALIAAVAIRRE